MLLEAFKAFPEAKKEKIIQEGVDLLRRQQKPNLSTVKRLLDEKYRTNICLGTIRNRASGKHEAARRAHSAQQLLSHSQENVLVEWITLLSDTGHSISKDAVRRKAKLICGRRPGETWIYHFLERHPDITLGKPSGLDPKRAQAFNQPTVKRHFELLEAIIKKYDIPPENIYNMDEKGVQRGGGRKVQARKYLIPRDKRPKYKLRSSNLELVTIVECVAADGGFLSPGIIFEGKQQYERGWFEVDPRISIGLSDNGWTSDFHCLQWFKDNFIPQAEARNTSGRPILLVYDGHGSHEKYELLQLATDHNIFLFSLPPHTTHKLQPLDVGVFGPFSRTWIERCNNYMEEHLDEIPRDQFVKHYAEVWHQTFKDTTIQTAFRKSGVWPINHNLFTDADFAPSIHTSSTARDVPDSYPVRVDELPAHQLSSDKSPGCQSPSNDDHESDNDSDDDNESRALPSSSTLSDNTPIPPSRFYSKAPAPARRGRDTEAYIMALENEVSVLRQENEELAAHATLAFDHVRGLKHRLNAKVPGSKRRKLNTESRWLNSDEGLAACERQEAEEKAKAAEKQARADERQAEEKEWQQQRERRDPNEPFIGALNSRKKAELQDIAYVLGVDIEGKVEDLKSKINAYFNEHEELRTSPHYIGLFPQLARQARQVAPASTLSHSLHNITNTQASNHQIIEYNQFTLDAHNQHYNQAQQHALSQPCIQVSTGTYWPPGPSNWPSGLVPPGYIAHNPPYYNVNT